MIPHDLAAEAALIGDLINLPGRIEETAAKVAPSDFYKPEHGRVFAAIVRLHDQGEKVTAVSLVDELRREGSADSDTPNVVMNLVGQGSGGYRRYADIVIGHALRRKVIAAASGLLEAAQSGKGDATSLLEDAAAAFAAIDVPNTDLPGDFHDFDHFLDRGVEHRAPWVIPGLLRQDWRAIIVAAEGAGKSVVLRSFALMAAQGIHPFNQADIDRVRTLLVDLENPDDAIVQSCSPIREQTRRMGRYQPGRAWLWHRPGGINIRNRADRATFDAILSACKPDLVCMGPLYKLYRRNPNETDEQAAEGCQQALDDLRTRHRFALFMEHHAPKGHLGTRDMTPYGSSYWLRWPEVGIGMEPSKAEPGWLDLKRWRGDRLPSSWPERIQRDPQRMWPWVGKWPAGQRYDDYLEETA